jgi:hypothetical protein
MLHRTNFKIFLLLLRIHRSCCYCVPIQQDSIEAYIEAFQQFAGYDLDASRHSTKGIPPNELAAIVTAIVFGYDLKASRCYTARISRSSCYCYEFADLGRGVHRGVPTICGLRLECIEAFHRRHSAERTCCYCYETLLLLCSNTARLH